MQGLRNKKVLITAGASGLGKATAVALYQAGAQVHICDIDAAALQIMAAEYPDITSSQTDVGNPDCVAALFKEVRTLFANELHFLVNNAGIAGPAGPLQSLDIEAWKATFNINLHATFYVSRLAIPMLKQAGGGAIMNLSSTAGL